MPAVSIIVPFYNAEARFAHCLRSLFSQSFEDLEFVFVDDGSTDASVAVLEEVASCFPSRREQIRLVRQDANQGSAAARRIGVSSASGDWLIFADADDELAPDCCLKLYQEAIRSDADMVVCDYDEYADGQARKGFFDLTDCRDWDKRLRDSITLRSAPFIWNKLVRRELYLRPDFVWPAANIAEDWMISVQLDFYAEKTAAVNEKLYHYFIYDGSLSHVSTAEKSRYMARVRSEQSNIEQLESLFRSKGLYEKYRREFDARKTNVKRMMFPLLDSREMRREWRRTFCEINWRILANSYTPMEYKIKHLCAMAGVYTPAYSLFKRIVR